MGQYWMVVNLDKQEFLSPHRLGTGLKLWEQLASHPGTGAALIVLCAAMPEPRGGGDFDMDENWHGPERPKYSPFAGQMPESYPEIAKLTIGRWAGDRIALVVDYADDWDLPIEFEASKIYGDCSEAGPYTDISDYVARVIEHELSGKFVGDGWRKFVYDQSG